MQFIVVGKDHKEHGFQRRQEVRTEHLQLGDVMIKQGTLKYAAATLDESGKMNGSVMVVEFESRSELDAWLEKEPYVVGKVWDQIEVTECKIGPSFLGK